LISSYLIWVIWWNTIELMPIFLMTFNQYLDLDNILKIHTVPSKSSRTKWKYFPTISKSMLILNDIFKQHGSRSGPTKRWAWSSVHIVETQHHILLKFGCMSWDDLNADNIGTMSCLQIVHELLEGTVDTFIALESFLNCLIENENYYIDRKSNNFVAGPGCVCLFMFLWVFFFFIKIQLNFDSSKSWGPFLQVW